VLEVEYRPKFRNDIPCGIECIGDIPASSLGERLLRDIEMKVDIARAKKAGCVGIIEICMFLNGEL